jgi:hypothetical protein
MRLLPTAAVWALVARGAAEARADLFSPGPLAKPHSSLEGLSQCSMCHASGGDEDHFQEKCLACHTELAPRVAKGLGFHGRLSEEKRDCKNCHHDHQGVDFKMVEWTPWGWYGPGLLDTGPNVVTVQERIMETQLFDTQAPPERQLVWTATSATDGRLTSRRNQEHFASKVVGRLRRDVLG